MDRSFRHVIRCRNEMLIPISETLPRIMQAEFKELTSIWKLTRKSTLGMRLRFAHLVGLVPTKVAARSEA
jgi:hypothetical protein